MPKLCCGKPQATRATRGFVIYLSTQSDSHRQAYSHKLCENFVAWDGKINDPRSIGVLYEYQTHMLKSEAFATLTRGTLRSNLAASVDLQYLLDERGKAERGRRLRSQVCCKAPQRRDRHCAAV